MENLNEIQSEVVKILHHTRSDDFHTHVSLIHPLGRYNIERTNLENFWSHYCDEIQNGVILGIAEKPGTYLPVLVDFDLKVKVDDCENTESLYNESQLHSIVRDYDEVIKAVVKNCQDYHLYCFVLEKPAYRCVYNDVEYIKHGFHLAYPYVFLTKTEHEQHIKPRIQKLAEKNTCFENYGFPDMSKLLDHCYLNNHWLLYGSQKNDRLDTKPYLLSYVLDEEREKIDTFTALKDYRIYDSEENPIQITSKNWNSLLPRILSTNLWFRTEYCCEISEKIKSLSRLKGLVAGLNPQQKKVFQLQNLTERLKISQDYLNILNKERASNYSDWIHIGWALFNISDGDEVGLKLWLAFSSRAEEKFDEDQCIHLWEKMENRGNMTERTLRFYAYQDNPIETEKIDQQRVKNQLQDLVFNKTHYDTAMAMKQLYGSEFICSSIQEKSWYQYKDHKWKWIGDGSDLRLKLSSTFHEIVKDLAKTTGDNFGQAVLNTDKAERTKATNTGGEIAKFLVNLKSNTFKNSVMKEMLDVFYDEKFAHNLDKNNYLIGFKNGVYDLTNNIFRKGIPEDYISKQIPYEYSIYEPTDPIIAEIEDVFAKIFTDKEVREYVKDISADLFCGGNFRKHLYLYTGSGNNGKSVFQLILEKLFGNEYYVKLPTSLLVGKRGQSGQANPELARAGNGVRAAVIQEPDKTEAINVGFIKELTGGNDSMYIRDLYQKGKDIREMEVTCKITIICNDLPKAENADAAFWHRIRVIPFTSTFSDNAPASYEEQVEKKIFPKDVSFQDKIPRLVKPLAWYLLERRKSHLKFYEPEAVRSASLRYRNRNDTFGSFLGERIENGNPKSNLYTKTVISDFNEWFKETKPGKKQPEKDELMEYLIRMWGEPENGLWYGKKFKEQDNQLNRKIIEE